MITVQNIFVIYCKLISIKVVMLNFAKKVEIIGGYCCNISDFFGIKVWNLCCKHILNLFSSSMIVAVNFKCNATFSNCFCP
jgi:hypothetical protein